MSKHSAKAEPASVEPVTGSEPKEFLDAARDAFDELTRQLLAAAKSGDHETHDRITRQLAKASEAKRANAAPAAPEQTSTTPVPATNQGSARRKARPAPLVPDKDRWPSTWGDQYRGVPNELIRNALFNIRHHELRQKFDNMPIASLRNQVMFYSGEELRIRDEDVMMQVFHFQRDFKIGEPWRVNGRDFLASMRWSDGKRGYKELYESLLRLSKGHVSILRRDGDEDKVVIEAGAILSHLKIEHAARGGPTEITITVNPDTRRLWETMGYTLVNWEQRLQLRGALARYLHRFYSSHDVPFPYKVETLRNLTGSSVSTEAKFRQMLREALASLVEMGFLDNFWIDSSDLVHVVRIQKLGNSV